MIVKEFSTDDALVALPELKPLDFEAVLGDNNFDFYITALGFEERTLSIPKNLLKIGRLNNFSCDELVYLVYNTSTNDNTFNESPLRATLEEVKDRLNNPAIVTSMFCDDESFSQLLKAKFQKKTEKQCEIRVLLDISVCSSKLILSLLKIVFGIKQIKLIVLYSEAMVYYPLYSEFIKNKEKFLSDSELSSTRGHEITINSNEYSEGAKENPDMIVAFAPFKVGRINKIISDIDESILLNNDGRLIWVIGNPNFETLDEKTNRMEMLKEINSISVEDDCKILNISTLNYKETISVLDNLYQQNPQFHINIADLGSKMQTLGISLFYHIRPDVSVYYAIPQKYNSTRYSSGVKAHWYIDFGHVKSLKDLINQIDCLEIEYDLNEDYPPIPQN